MTSTPYTPVPSVLTIIDAWMEHPQFYWQEQAHNHALPLWVRVTAFGHGWHAANGHAPFESGELVAALANADPATGEGRNPHRSSIYRAIRKAKGYGLLGEQSGSRCLAVPTCAVTGGERGSAGEPCAQHERTRRGRRDAPASNAA